MKLQQSIIKKFKQTYPQKNLIEISKMTGIQKTRIFRIFNGSPMKLSEYEIFSTIISSKTINMLRFIDTANECLQQLSSERLKKILLQMNHNLKVSAQLNFI